jgi:hypothetical protein
MYVLLILYIAVSHVPYSDLLVILSLICMIKLASASMMLLSIIELSRKLPNNLKTH